MSKKTSLFVGLCLFAASFSLNAETVRREAFDSERKFQAVNVDEDDEVVVQAINKESKAVLLINDTEEEDSINDQFNDEDELI